MSEAIGTIGILVADIDKKLSNLHDYYRSYEPAKKLEPAKVLTPAQKKMFFEILQADREIYQLRLKIAKLREKLEKSAKIGRKYEKALIEIGTEELKHPHRNLFSFSTYTLRETRLGVQQRIGDTKAARAKRREQLRNLRERAMLAAAAGQDLTPFIQELGTIK